MENIVVNVGCIPETDIVRELTNPCVFKFCKGTQSHKMFEVKQECKTLGFFPEITSLLLELAGFPLQRQFLIPTNTESYGVSMKRKLISINKNY